MAILDTHTLRDRGAALAGGYRTETRKLVLLYCGVIALLSLGSNALYLVLDGHIDGTGGLDGLGMRSVLQTAQEILSYINTFFSPFWSAGFLYAMLGLVRGEAPRPLDLLEGFRRFVRVLSACLYQLMLIFSLVLITGLLTMMIYIFSPWGTAVGKILAPVADQLILADGTVNMAAMPDAAYYGGVVPMTILWMCLFAAAWIWISYGFRMSVYLMMERRIGGVASLFVSRRLMKGHKRQMLKLDLRFWWYHGLTLLIGVVCYLDVILAMLGIDVPLSDTVMFFATLGAYCVLLTALSLWKKCEVDAAYLLAFEAIAHPEPVEVLREVQ